MFEMDLTVRFSETDGAGHVGNTVMVVWFEEARAPLFKMFMPTLEVDGWPLILASYQVDFRAQLYYGKPVTIKTWVKRIGNSSFETYQEAWQNQQCCAAGSTTMVHFDYAAGKASPIPADIRDKLNRHLYQEK
ncbi:MAG: thioesterase family protein [Pseudomonadota bacterium]|nr:thioesterase family protein [Pseudomonadota bacterium]